MKLSPEGLAFLSHEEGFRTHPYDDQAGKPRCIGAGHLVNWEHERQPRKDRLQAMRLDE